MAIRNAARSGGGDAGPCMIIYAFAYLIVRRRRLKERSDVETETDRQAEKDRQRKGERRTGRRSGEATVSLLTHNRRGAPAIDFRVGVRMKMVSLHTAIHIDRPTDRRADGRLRHDSGGRPLVDQ